MPDGKVIDPNGGDSAGPKWGYIERNDQFWPGTSQHKVIPFKNVSSLQLDDEITFDVHQVDPDKGNAMLAIAKNVKLKPK